MLKVIGDFLTCANIRRRVAAAKAEADKPTLAKAMMARPGFSWPDQATVAALRERR